MISQFTSRSFNLYEIKGQIKVTLFKMQYILELLSDCSTILHRGAVSIKEYICRVNMALLVKLVQLRVNMTK